MNSDSVSTDLKNDITDANQNVTFVETAPQMSVDINTDPIVEDPSLISNLPSVSLAGFLERPQRIYNFEWDNTTVPFSFNPYTLFLNDPNIQDKVTKFKLLRAHLHLRFTINGTPFHYGRLLCAYEPALSNAAAHDPDHLISISQLPHVLLDPGSNVTMEMELPFLKPDYFIDLTKASGAQLGVIHVNPMNTVQMANAATVEPVTVSIFAWMTDVSLTLPVPTPVATFVPISGRAKMSEIKNTAATKGFRDEYGEGLISAPASALAAVAGRLKDIPVIGKFATATQIGAGAVSGIAKLFGFSKPVNLDAVKPMRMKYFSPLANTAGEDGAFKLTLDPKQELTIDTRPMDLGGDDQMTFEYIQNIPSFCGKFDWDTTQGVGGTIAWIPVTPNMRVHEAAVDGGEEYSLTPTALISETFQKWTGTMDVHLQIVSSRYHRGRLRVTWLPGEDDVSWMDPTSFNDALTYVIDISEETDYSFRVGWGSPLPYLDTDLNGIYFDGTTGGLPANSACNGVLHVAIVNELVSPLATQGVQVNVWTKGGPDLEFQMPQLPVAGTVIGLTASISGVGSKAEMMKGVEPAQLNTKGVCCEVPLNFYDTSPRDSLALVHYGEKCVSVRSLIKRYVPWSIIYGNCPSGINWSRHYGQTLPLFPAGPGVVPNGKEWTRTTAGNPYNITVLGYLAWFQNAFYGYKGSTRYKVALEDPAITATADGGGANPENAMSIKPLVQISRMPTDSTYDVPRSWRDSTAYTTSGDVIEALSINTPSSLRYGGEIQANTTNNMYGLEFEIPDYNANLYHTDVHGAVAPGENFETALYNAKVQGYYDHQNAFPNPSTIYSAAGEDYSMIFFKGVPRVRIQTFNLGFSNYFPPAL